MPVAFEDVPVDLTPILDWVFSPGGLITILVTLLIVAGVVTVLGVMIFRAVRRRLPRGSRLVDRAVTSWRTQSLPEGPRRELAELRTRLEESVRATDQQLAEAERAGVPTGSLPSLAGRLRSGGEHLDGHLRRLEREPDEEQASRELPAARQQVESVCSAAASMREAARAAAMEFSAAGLEPLLERAELEVAAVSSGTKSLRGDVQHDDDPRPT